MTQLKKSLLNMKDDLCTWHDAVVEGSLLNMKDDLCERPQSLITHAYCHLCGKILLVLKGVNIKKLGQLIIVQKSTAVLPDCKCFCIFEN